MQVKSTVRLKMPVIRKLDTAASRALEQAAEAVHTDLVQSQTMPFDSGNLQNESTSVQMDGSTARIVTNTSYARRLYYHPEYHFQTKENPDAGGAWFEPYLDGGAKDQLAAKAFAKCYKKEAGL